MLARLSVRWLTTSVIAALFIAVFTGASITSSTIKMSSAQITGDNMSSCLRWKVCGTDLGIPYLLENGSVGYLFGDTFTTTQPGQGGYNGWRSPVMLRSSTRPDDKTPIVFDSAAGITGNGQAPSIMPNGKNTGGEFSVIPNDGISFPETKEQIVSYMSIKNWDATDATSWQTNYAGLAWSPDGNHFYRIGPHWDNNPANKDPFQMWSMQRDGAYVYIISVRAGRQQGPMMLRRVAWDKMLDQTAYECWNGTAWGSECLPLFTGRFGEPSLRKLHDGTWAMSYLDADAGAIMTRVAMSPNGPWSGEKAQLFGSVWDSMYGGFIHPYSTRNNLTLMVSTWRSLPDGTTVRYDVSQLQSTLQPLVANKD